ncbi:MAG TPA: type VI secretion system contractile sheath large subunit, partial [Polyangiaceae bacterium]
RALANAQRVVIDVASRKTSVDAGRAQLARILPRHSWADALLREVRTEERREPPPEGSRGGGAVGGPPKGGLDAFLDGVDLAPSVQEGERAPAPPAEQPRSAIARAVEEVARTARPNVAARPVVGSAPQRLEKAFRNLLDSILHHPEVHRLESTWRGVRLLVENGDQKTGVEIDLLHASRDGVTAALKQLTEPDADRAPVDLVVVDQRIAPEARDLDLLEAWGSLASQLLAPVVVSGHPAMLGADTLSQVARSTGALSTSDDPRAVAVRGVASREAARWIAIVLNDPLVRAPYTAATARQQQPPYDEDAADLARHVFASGAYVVGALCARSHARLRWATSITGVRDGAVGDLPVHTIRDRGVEAAVPLEVVPSEEVVREVARAGLTLLTCAPNSDAAVLAKAPVLHRPGGGQGPSDATLADQLFVGRFARAVQQVAAAIPAGTDASAAAEVARIALSEMFERAAPPGPEIVAKVDAARGALNVTIRPRRFAGVSMDELTLGAALG